MLGNKLCSDNGLSFAQQNASSNPGVIGWMTRVLGCWHRELSRPFSSQGQTYRVCVRCGARRPFNLVSWKMQGDFYYSLPTPKASSSFGQATSREVIPNLREVSRPIQQYA
jgi:hypothetical protein